MTQVIEVLRVDEEPGESPAGRRAGIRRMMASAAGYGNLGRAGNMRRPINPEAAPDETSNSATEGYRSTEMTQRAD